MLLLATKIIVVQATETDSFAEHGRPVENDKTVIEGRNIYDRSCSYCHGLTGKGDGPVAFYLSREIAPRPRDFTDGVYKFRSSVSGDLPLDEDLFRTITRGINGYMPGFSSLSATARWKLVYYIKSLYPEFNDIEPEVIKQVGKPLPATAISIRKGYEVFQQFKCWECHGRDGRGNGEKAADLKDDWGFRLPPQDLTRMDAFKNGREPVDLYRSIMTGFDGSAMPAYGDFFAGSEDDLWHLINYIRSLSE